MPKPRTAVCVPSTDPVYGELDLTGIDFGAIIALASTSEELAHLTHRMLQALDGYWLHYDGYNGNGHPKCDGAEERWWGRFEKYRARVESLIALNAGAAQ